MIHIFVLSSPEVSFDERIALELDALDHLGTVESPIAELQAMAFQRSQSNGGSDEFDNNQHKAFNDRVIDVRRTEDIMDCDEVRIMIKVLGAKVRVN